MLAPNTVVQGRYVIVRPIGQGGMGAVYEALDQRLRSTVALKQTLVSNSQLDRAFQREAELLANLRHPALPRVMDYFADGGEQFLVMEYIPGDDLGVLLDRRNAPFPVEAVARWADQLLDALDYLHKQQPPITHRDIKPQNLKLTGRDEIILLDFGLAKGAVAWHAQEASLHSVAGYTPQYAPLEQIQGAGTSARSDLYALGATIYHFITNEMPANAIARASAMVGQMPDPLRPAHKVNPQIPREFSLWLNQSLMLDPAKRFASARAMRSALRMCLEPVTVATLPHLEKQEKATVSQPEERGTQGTQSDVATRLMPEAKTESHKETYVSRPVLAVPTAHASVTEPARFIEPTDNNRLSASTGKQPNSALRWALIGGVLVLILLIAAAAGWLLLRNGWGGWSQTTSAGQADVKYPALLAVEDEARAGETVYKILSAQLDRYSADKLALKLQVRVYHEGGYGVNIYNQSFRLLVDGVTIAPSDVPSLLVEAYSAEVVPVTFAFPAAAKKVELQVGQENQETNSIAIDLKKTKAPSQETPPPSALSRLKNFPADLESGQEARAGEMLYKLLAAQIDAYSSDKVTVKFRVEVTNEGAYGANVYQTNFRLFADGVPLAPTRTSNELLQAEETKEIEVRFVVPTSTNNLELQVGSVGKETSKISLSLAGLTP